MSDSCCHHGNNEAAPRQVLGLVKKNWKLEDLRQFLAHHNVPYCTRGTKNDLMRLLERLSLERGLTIEDRRRLQGVLRTRASRPSKRARRIVAIIVPQVRTVAVTPGMRHQSPAEVQTEPHLLLQPHTEPGPEPESGPQTGSGSQVEEAPNVIIINDSAVGDEIHCSICMEKCGEDQIPSRPVTAACNHDRDICLACLKQSISIQFEVKMWNQLCCPCCAQLLSHKDVKDFGDPVIFERYERICLEDCLSESQLRACQQAGCQSRQLCFPGDSYFICHSCGGKTCISCKVVWHPDVSCERARGAREATLQERQAEDERSTEYLRRNTKYCPRCRSRTVRDGGCDHITCSRCLYEYCWLCSANHKLISRQGNAHHRLDCPHHSKNLPRHPHLPADHLRPTGRRTLRPPVGLVI